MRTSEVGDHRWLALDLRTQQGRRLACGRIRPSRLYTYRRLPSETLVVVCHCLVHELRIFSQAPRGVRVHRWNPSPGERRGTTGRGASACIDAPALSQSAQSTLRTHRASSTSLAQGRSESHPFPTAARVRQAWRSFRRQ